MRKPSIGSRTGKPADNLGLIIEEVHCARIRLSFTFFNYIIN